MSASSLALVHVLVVATFVAVEGLSSDTGIAKQEQHRAELHASGHVAASISSSGSIAARPTSSPIIRHAVSAPPSPEAFTPATTKVNYGHPPWLHDCGSIYLDIGTQTGLQVEMLFDPTLNANSTLSRFFGRVFGQGKNRSDAGVITKLCALGIAPDPNRRKNLTKLEGRLRNDNFHVHFYNFLPWNADGLLSVNWTSSTTKVVTADIMRFISTLPAGAIKLMRMDIGSYEYEVILRLIEAQQLCQGTIDNALLAVYRKGINDEWQDERTFDAIDRRVQGIDCANATWPTALWHIADEALLLRNAPRRGRTTVLMMAFALASLVAAVPVAIMALQPKAKDVGGAGSTSFGS